MKFMKLGSKPDSLQSNGDNIRYMETELPADIVVNVANVKFYLHKYPLLSKSALLHKLITTIASQENKDEINIPDIPGGPTAFEICAKYCYGITVTLNAHNVIAARCAAEYLQMSDTIEKGNLIYKIDIFLNSSIFKGWKDSIIVLQTTPSLLPWSEDLKLVNRCVDSLASKASIDTSEVEWSYTYNRRKLPLENGVQKQPTIPTDWWVEDLCDLDIDLYKRVITTIKSKRKVSNIVIGEALRTYAWRRLPGFSNGTVEGGDTKKNQTLVETITRLLPKEKGSVSCSFLLSLLRESISLGCGETVRTELLKRIGLQLDEATMTDLLIRAPPGETSVYDVDMVQTLVKEFVMQEDELSGEYDIKSEIEKPRIVSNTSKGLVAKLVDRYLAEVSKDPNLPLSKFVGIAELVLGYPRPSHDGIYRAIDMYLKEHPGINKSEKKRICKFMDCRKLSAEACAHAVQNERLPLRVVVQVIFFEQAQSQKPDLSGPIKSMIPGGSNGSSRSTATNTEEDWEGDEVKAIKGELARLRLRDTQATSGNNPSNVKGSLIPKRMFPKLWSNKDNREGENSSSDTSESPGSTKAEEMRSTPSRNRRR